ncbi:glutamate--tRNA ligase family protein [Leptolyngbya boryana]|uniref:glutamate--tRNA ligase family protein n=1 Tax=Leptolyngbya boryana TaxID=1184 RepID=UPI002931A6B0|nr:glutamate--tRNA ligase family protein [Leptolyngbya boryana]
MTSISDFKEMGYTAEAIANYMTLLGWSPPELMTEIFTLAEAAEQFSFDRVNKAGAKFDWDKLNWINGQYIHAMPVSEATNLLIPVWKSAGYEFDAERDRAWLEQITALVAPSLARLNEAADMTRYLFQSLDYTDDAKAQMQQDGAATAIQAILDAMPAELTETATQDVIKQVVKEQNLKKAS